MGDGHVEDARHLAERALSLVRDGEVRDAGGLLLAVEDLVEADGSGGVARTVRDAAVQIDAVASEVIELEGVSVSGEGGVDRLQQWWLVRYRVAVALLVLVDRRLEVLDRIVELAQPGMGDGRRLADWALLERGRVLGEGGRYAEEVEAFDGLVARWDLDPPENPDYLVGALYGRCRALAISDRLPEAVAAVEEFVSRYLPADGLSVRSRDCLADAMWIRCRALWGQSTDSTDPLRGEAIRLLDELIVWLRDQPEPVLRTQLAWRLGDRLLWGVEVGPAVEVLEELVAVLVEVGDRDLIIHSTDTIVREMPWLMNVGDENWERLSGALSTAWAEEELPRDAGISDDAAVRTARLLAAMQRLDDLLGADERQSAAEPRAAVLVVLLSLFGATGRGEEALPLYDELMELGPATVTACDRMIEDLVSNSAEPGSPESAIGPMTVKAEALEAQGKAREARAAYGELIEQFKARDNPAIVASVQHARERKAALGLPWARWRSSN